MPEDQNKPIPASESPETTADEAARERDTFPDTPPETTFPTPDSEPDPEFTAEEQAAGSPSDVSQTDVSPVEVSSESEVEAEDASSVKQVVEAEEVPIADVPPSAADDAEKSETLADDADEETETAPDYQTYTREELAVALETLVKEGDVHRAEAEAQRMRPHFDLLLDTEREVARQKFIADGGEEEGFDFRPDFVYERFLTAYRQIRSKKKAIATEQRKQRQNNLEVKQDILDRLRTLVDSEETQASLEQLRALQQEWRSTGPVPPAGQSQPVGQLPRAARPLLRPTQHLL